MIGTVLLDDMRQRRSSDGDNDARWEHHSKGQEHYFTCRFIDVYVDCDIYRVNRHEINVQCHIQTILHTDLILLPYIPLDHALNSMINLRILFY